MDMNKDDVFRKPVRVGILEIRRHPVVLYTFSRIFKTENTDVTIFTTEELLSRFKTWSHDQQRVEYVVKNRGESNFSFLRRVEKICSDRIDLLFVNTIHETFFDLLGHLCFNPSCRMVLTVHHVNAWFKPELRFNLKHPVRTIDNNLSSVLIKFILPKFDAVNVIYPPLKEYILKNTNY